MARIGIEDVGQPGKTCRVDAAKLTEMRPHRDAAGGAGGLARAPPPGLTPAALIAAMKPLLDQTLFPGGKTAGWWVKAVHLDMAAKKVIARAAKSPVRLSRL